jgi:anti-sigma factor RsiW
MLKPTCAEIDPLLSPYVDGETAAVDRARVEAHLDACPPCRAVAEAERRCRDLLRARREALAPASPAALRARCARLARPASRRVARRWAPLSMAATLVLAAAGVLLFGLLGPADRSDALAAELADDHVRCFQRPPASETPRAARQVADEWASRHGWTLRVPAGSAAEALELLDARGCRFSGGGLAHLLYALEGRPVSVFVIPGRRAVEAALEIRDHEAVIWSQDGDTYGIVAREPRHRVERLARYVRQQIGS